MATTRFLLFVVTDGSDKGYSEKAVDAIGPNPNVTIIDVNDPMFEWPNFNLMGTPTLFDQANIKAFRGEYAILYLEKMQTGVMDLIPPSTAPRAAPAPRVLSYGATATAAPYTRVSQIYSPVQTTNPMAVAPQQQPLPGKPRGELGAHARQCFGDENEDDSCITIGADGQPSFRAKSDAGGRRRRG